MHLYECIYVCYGKHLDGFVCLCVKFESFQLFLLVAMKTILTSVWPTMISKWYGVDVLMQLKLKEKTKV